MKQYLFISALHVSFKYLGSIISVSSKGLLLHRWIQIVKYNSLVILILIKACYITGLCGCLLCFKLL